MELINSIANLKKKKEHSCDFYSVLLTCPHIRRNANYSGNTQKDLKQLWVEFLLNVQERKFQFQTTTHKVDTAGKFTSVDTT
jgi:hypothetical protein